jgi:phosphoglycerate dehydrogenase-like enzyme
MIIKIIEPIGISDNAIRARIGDLIEEGGHQLLVCETRGLADADLIKVIKDGDVLLLSNRPLSGSVINACSKLKLICVAFTGVRTTVAAG